MMRLASGYLMVVTIVTSAMKGLPKALDRLPLEMLKPQLKAGRTQLLLTPLS